MYKQRRLTRGVRTSNSWYGMRKKRCYGSFHGPGVTVDHFTNIGNRVPTTTKETFVFSLSINVFIILIKLF